MSDLNPYEILGSMFNSGRVSHETLKEEIRTVKTVTKGRGKNKRTEEVETVKVRVKRGNDGKPLYKGGSKASSFVMGGIEICLYKQIKKDDHGNERVNYLVALHESSSGTSTNKVDFETALRLGLFKRLSKGQNVWEAFNS